jgi:hypothetical protein
MSNLFDRLDRGRPPAEAKQPTKPSKEQRLLDWLLEWPQPTICAAQILMYGPRSTRNRKDANDAIEVLVRRGWLNPQPTNQSNWRQWRIVRKPVVDPTIAD